MMGSPPPRAVPPLPPPPLSFSSIEDDAGEPQRGEDSYDLLSGWARALSVSPRLYPTYGTASGIGSDTGAMSATFGSYRGLGDASPLLGPSSAPRQQSLTVGTGLSPVLGPTHMHMHMHSSSSASWGLGGIGSGSSAMLMASGQGNAFDYASFGQQYHAHAHAHAHAHTSPPSSHAHSLSQSQSPQTNSHDLARQRSLPGATQSYSNIDQPRSMSPADLPPPLHPRTPNAVAASPLGQPPQSLNLSPKVEPDAHLATPPDPAEPPPEDEDPRIRAYAKLEFPTFDIYIQKLSVIVGRRPAGAKDVPAPAAPPARASAQPATPSESKRAESESQADGVKLEDFVVEMNDDDARRDDVDALVKAEQPADGLMLAVKQEDSIALPHLAFTPSSRPNSPGSSMPFSEFLRSSPPPVASTSAAADELSASSNPPLTADALATAAETRDLLDMLTLAVAEGNQKPQDSLADANPTAATSGLPHSEQQPAASEVAPSDVAAAAATAPPQPQQILTDIDLGPIRAVSRQHARLYFDYELGQWAIEVLGRNGVVVEGKWKAKGEREGLGKRTKIQIAERIFYFVLPTIDPPAPAEPATAAPNGINAGTTNDSDEDEDDEHDDDDGDSSSLSEMSDSAIELSPLLNPVTVVPSPAPAPLPALAPAPPAASTPSLAPPPVRKPEKKPRASTSASAVAGPSNPQLLALAPPVRAASRNVNYGGATAGKRIEVLQAVRSAKGAGKGKSAAMGAGKMGGGGRGKGKMGKGKSVLPTKKPRTQSFGDGDGDDEVDSDDSDDSDDDEAHGDDVFMTDRVAPRKHPVVPLLKKKKASDSRKVAVKAPHQHQHHAVPSKQPKRDLVQARAPAPVPLAAPALPRLPAQADLPVLPPLPAPIATAPAAAPAKPADSTPFLPPLPPAPKPSKLYFPAPHASSASGVSTAPTPGPSSSNAVAPTPFSLPPGAPGTPGGPPIKRGRGRPPKNGICAQRPRKPKPDANGVLPPTAAQIAAMNVAAAEARARHGGIDIDPSLPTGPVPDLQVFPTTTTSTAPADDLRTIAYPSVPDTLPDGARPPVAAPADDLYSKPPYTYASLIAQAVSSAESHKLTLNGIYDWITARWPYFSDNQNGWQNSIRHNLTLSRGFLKIARREDEPGKGAFWAIDPAQIRNFDGLNFRKKMSKSTVPPGPKPAPMPKPPPAPKPPKPPVAGPSKPVIKKPNPAPRPPPGTPSLSTPLPIIVGPIPDSYVRPTQTSSTATDDLTAALLKDPPIVLHEGKLILNPSIFAHLTKEQLDNLQVLAASAALQILQAYVVDHFKEKMRKARVAAAAQAMSQSNKRSLEDGAGTPAAAQPAAPTISPSPALEATNKRKADDVGSADIEISPPAPKVAKREVEVVDLTGP